MAQNYSKLNRIIANKRADKEETKSNMATVLGLGTPGLSMALKLAMGLTGNNRKYDILDAGAAPDYSKEDLKNITAVGRGYTDENGLFNPMSKEEAAWLDANPNMRKDYNPYAPAAGGRGKLQSSVTLEDGTIANIDDEGNLYKTYTQNTKAGGSTPVDEWKYRVSDQSLHADPFSSGRYKDDALSRFIYGTGKQIGGVMPEGTKGLNHKGQNFDPSRIGTSGGIYTFTGGTGMGGTAMPVLGNTNPNAGVNRPIRTGKLDEVIPLPSSLTGAVKPLNSPVSPYGNSGFNRLTTIGLEDKRV